METTQEARLAAKILREIARLNRGAEPRSLTELILVAHRLGLTVLRTTAPVVAFDGSDVLVLRRGATESEVLHELAEAILVRECGLPELRVPYPVHRHRLARLVELQLDG